MKSIDKTNNLIKVALIGYGSMGKIVEQLAPINNIIVTNIFDIDNPITQLNSDNYDFDVAIDFSIPSAVIHNVEILATLRKNIIIGTTGWYDEINKVAEIVTNNEIGCVWGANFSVGMQIFFHIADYVSRLNLSGYDVFLSEIHHKNKKDAPSGTAKVLSNIISDNLGYDINVSSVRGGYINGEHNIYIDSESDTIELTHKAKNRNGFATGAISAARWIAGKKGFYNFADIYEKL